MISKQRAKLRAKSNSIDTIINIGKEGITDTVLLQISDALNARELVKGKVLDSAMITPQEVGIYISAKLQAEVVCCIGGKFVIYKKNNSRALKNKIIRNRDEKLKKKYNTNYKYGKTLKRKVKLIKKQVKRG